MKPTLFTAGTIILVAASLTAQETTVSSEEIEALPATTVFDTPETANRPTPTIRKNTPLESVVIDDDAPIVTASRIVESSFTSPYVVERLSEQTLVDRAVRTVPEAFERTPGVLVQKTAHAHGAPFIRGFTSYHNVFLIDGVRLNNSTFRAGPNQYWGTVDSQGLRAIELVKSQGSVLYGSDAVGGTVQALTKRPVYAESGSFDQVRSYTRYSTGENSLMQRGEYSTSEAGVYGFRLGGTFKEFGDIEAAELGTLPWTGYGEWDLDAKLEIFLGDDALLTFFHQQVHQDDAWRVHKTRFGRSWAGTTVGNEQSRILDQHRVLSYLQLEGTADHPLFDHYVVNVSHHRQDEQRSRTRNDGRRDDQGVTVETFGVWSQFDQELPSTDLSYGFSYYRDEVNSFRRDYNADGSFRGARIQGPVGDDALYHLVGVFANSQTQIGDRLMMDLGVRGNYAEADIGRVQDPDTGNQFSISDNWSSVVGSGRISYRLDDEDRYRLFGGVSQAFRAPNLSDLSRLDSNRSTEIETPTPDLDSEHFLTFEFGLKAETEKVSGSISYFYTEVDDLILRSPTGRVVGGLNEVTKNNSGEGHVQGVEIEGEYQIEDSLTAFAGFAYQDSHVTTFPTSAPVLSEEVLSRLLPLNGFAGMRWDACDDLWFEGLVTVVDRADRINTRDSLDTQRIPPGGTPGYWLATVRAGWQARENLFVTMAVENIFDEDYRAHGSGNNEPGTSFVIGAEATY